MAVSQRWGDGYLPAKQLQPRRFCLPGCFWHPLLTTAPVWPSCWVFWEGSPPRNSDACSRYLSGQQQSWICWGCCVHPMPEQHSGGPRGTSPSASSCGGQGTSLQGSKCLCSAPGYKALVAHSPSDGSVSLICCYPFCCLSFHLFFASGFFPPSLYSPLIVLI